MFIVGEYSVCLEQVAQYSLVIVCLFSLNYCALLFIPKRILKLKLVTILSYNVFVKGQ